MLSGITVHCRRHDDAFSSKAPTSMLQVGRSLLRHCTAGGWSERRCLSTQM